MVTKAPLTVEYFTLASALGRALDHDSPEFWTVVTELEKVFPQYSWHNAMTDTGGTRMTTGADLIAAERQRQIDVEGWTPEHDASHNRSPSPLILAAVCYATHPGMRFHLPNKSVPSDWPWDDQYWKPTPDDRVRELVKAGALLAAEIDRLQAQVND